FVIGLNNAALTILAQQRGKKNEYGLKRYLNAFVVVLTSLSLVLSFFGFFFAEELLNLLGTPGNMLQQAKAYLQIKFVGISVLFCYSVIGTVLWSLCDSKAPLLFVLSALLANSVLCPLSTSGIGWGIEGAAYATIFSQGGAFLYALLYVLYKRLAPFRLPHL